MTEIVSIGPGVAVQAAGASREGTMTNSARRFAFTSTANNLVAADDNGVADVFVRDSQGATTIRASVDSTGGESNGASRAPSLSNDGRYCAFASDGSNLVAGDANGVTDVFVRDMTLGQTTRASVGPTGEANGGCAEPRISGGGNRVAFSSVAWNLTAFDGNGVDDVFVGNASGSPVLVSRTPLGTTGNGPSNAAALSFDGQVVAFVSEASDLVAVDSNGWADIFYVISDASPVLRCSVSTNGVESDGDSWSPSVSGDGRYIAFVSEATNLTLGDSNGMDDVFVKDTATGATTIESLSSLRIPGDGDSTAPCIAYLGRYVAFVSRSSNLVPGDTNAVADVFWRDRLAGLTLLASPTWDGNLVNGDCAGPVLSDDGRFVAFTSAATDVVRNDGNSAEDVFVFDRSSGGSTRVSVGSGGPQADSTSYATQLSGDGRYVAFDSYASNLVPADSNGTTDVFVRDRVTAITQRVSVGSGGIQSNGQSSASTITPDGRYVAFESYANNLVPGASGLSRNIYVHDRVTSTTSMASVTWNGSPGTESSAPAMSDDSRWLAFSSTSPSFVVIDANGNMADVFLRDRLLGVTTLESRSSTGIQGNSWSGEHGITGDGRYLVFSSDASNLVASDANGQRDVFRRDLTTGTTIRVSLTNSGGESSGNHRTPAISADGRYVAFLSDAQLTAQDLNYVADVYLRDVPAATTTLISLHTLGAFADGSCDAVRISADGQRIAFASYASDLVPGDTNASHDVFVHDRVAAMTQLVSRSSAGAQTFQWSGAPAISGDGSCVAFASGADNLVFGDWIQTQDIFVRDDAPSGLLVFCASKPNSQGCAPAIGYLGWPSVGTSAPFVIDAHFVINNKSGLLYYGFAAAQIPFQGGTRCVASPLTRTVLLDSGGHPPPDDCSGILSFDMGQRIQSGVDPSLGAGTPVFCQFWYRDPLESVSHTGLSDSLRFTIDP